MSRLHTFGKTLVALCGATLLIAVAGCAQGPHAVAQSWVVITDLPQWSPGRAQTYRQVVFRADGTVQDASVRDQTVESLVEFSQGAGFAGMFPVEPYFSLQDKYETPVQPGLMVEGRGDKTNFVFQAMGRMKFITAENALLPADLQKLRAQMPPKTDKGRTGTFIQVRLQDPVTQDYLRSSKPTPLTQAMVAEFEPLARALASPFQFVDIKPAQIEALAVRLSLRRPPFSVTTPSGEVVRVECFGY